MDMKLFYELAELYNLEFEEGRMTGDDVNYFTVTPMLIDIFIKQIRKSEYGNLIDFISYDLNKEDNTYFIWHNNSEIDKDINFTTFVGKLLRDTFFKHNIYNVCFCYDYEKSSMVYFEGYLKPNITSYELYQDIKKLIEDHKNKKNFYISTKCWEKLIYSENNFNYCVSLMAVLQKYNFTLEVNTVETGYRVSDN